MASKSDQDSVDARYRDILARRMRRVTVLRHLADNADGGSFGEIDLADLFVAPRFHADAEVQRRSEKVEELRTRLAANNLEPASRAYLEEHLAALEKHVWTPASMLGSRTSPLAELFPRGDPPVLVRGDPGSGKSTLLLALALAASNRVPALVKTMRLEEALPDGVVGRFPIHVALGGFAATEMSLLDYLRNSCDAIVPGAGAVLDTQLGAGTALILLDGLDEIPDPRRRAQVARRIETFLADTPPNRCVITTRPEGGLPIGGAAEVHLAPLERAQIHRLLTNLLRRARRVRAIEADVSHDVDDLLQQLDRAGQLDDLVRNPLLVTIVAASRLASAVLPRDRVLLYHRIVKTLLETWEEARHLADHSPAVPAADLLIVWSDVALAAQRHGDRPRRREAWEHDVRHALARHGHEPVRSAELARAYLEMVTRRAGLLAPRGAGEFAFWHPTFGEYLAGIAVAREPHRLMALRADPRTVEIAAFALGYLARLLDDQPRAERLLLTLADEHTGPWEHLFAPALRYAAACLVRTPLQSPALWDSLFVRLVERARALPYAPHLDALDEFLRHYPVPCPGPDATRALLALIDDADGERTTLALQRLASNPTDPLVRARCEAVLADTHARIDHVVPAALALLRFGLARPDVCSALVQRELFAAQTYGPPFGPTPFGRSILPLVRDQAVRVALNAHLANADVAAALLLALLDAPDPAVAVVLERHLADRRPFEVRTTRSPAAVEVALGWLALKDESLRTRILDAALEAPAERDLKNERHPWQALGGLLRQSTTREAVVHRVADEVLRAPAASASPAWTLVNRLIKLGGEAFQAALETALADRLVESDDPARLALRLVHLQAHGLGSRRSQTPVKLFEVCLADLRPWLRDAALQRLRYNLGRRAPSELREATIMAAIANLAAEEDPDAEDWPKLPDHFSGEHQPQPRHVREHAVESLAEQYTTGQDLSPVTASLVHALQSPSASRRGWAAVLLARAHVHHEAIPGVLSVAVLADAIELAAEAANLLLDRPELSDDLRARCHEALWLDHAINSFGRARTFTVKEPPSDETIDRLLARQDLRNYSQGLAWLFTNPHTVAILCRRILHPIRGHEDTARFILRGARDDPHVTDELVRIIGATPPDYAGDLVWLLHLRLSNDGVRSGPLDPRVVRAHDHCLDSADASTLWFPIRELLYGGHRSERLQTAIRRCLRDGDMAARHKTMDACLRESGHGLPRPVDPNVLRDALQITTSLALAEIVAILTLCGTTDDAHDRLDAAAYLMALAAPALHVHAILDSLCVAPGAPHGDASLFSWVLPKPWFEGLIHRPRLRCDHIAATLLQRLDGTPLPPHLLEEALAELRDPQPSSFHDPTIAWVLRVLLREGGLAADVALQHLAALLCEHGEIDRHFYDPNDREHARLNQARQHLENAAIEAVIACADHPAVAALWIRLAIGESRHRPYQLGWKHISYLFDKVDDKTALRSALDVAAADAQACGLLAARVLCVVGDTPLAAIDRVLDAHLDGYLEEFEHEKGVTAERATIWPRLRSRWQAGELTSTQFARALRIAAHGDIPADDLTSLIDPLLDASQWRLRCPAVALCSARALPVAPDRLHAALRACVVGAPDLSDLTPAIRGHVEFVLPELRKRVEAAPDDYAWLLADLPALRQLHLDRLWRKIERDNGDEPLRSLWEQLRRLAVPDAEIIVRLLPRLVAGDSAVARLLHERHSRPWPPQDSSWHTAGSSDTAIRCGLLLAQHPEWLDEPIRENLANTLDRTAADLDTLLAAVTADPGDIRHTTSARVLAEHRPDDPFARRLASAWWFGQLPHDRLATHEPPPPAPNVPPTQAGESSMTSSKALHDLLCGLFPAASDLRRFLGQGPDGEEIKRHLPGEGVALALVVDMAISETQRRGLLAETFARLVEAFGRRFSEIQPVARAFGVEVQPPAGAEATNIKPAGRPANAGSGGAAPPAVAQAEASPLRWLQLSDLHVGCRGESTWWTMLDRLWRSLDRWLKVVGAPDLVFLTGDLTNRGERAEFDRLSKFMEKLLARLPKADDGLPPLVVAVPGNHDLQRPSGSGARQYRLLRDYEKGNDDPDVAGLMDELWNKSDASFLQPLFANYQEWFDGLIRPQGGRLGVKLHTSFFPGDLMVSLDLPGRFPLAIVGLNSAWMQYQGGDFEGKLALPVEQFHAALPHAVGTSPLGALAGQHRALLLMHHPRGWLSKPQRQLFDNGIYPGDRFAACLHGHMHEADSVNSSRAGGTARCFYQAPSLFGMEEYGTAKESRAFGYTWGKLQDDGELHAWPLKWQRKGDGVEDFDRDPFFHWEDGPENVLLRAGDGRRYN